MQRMQWDVLKSIKERKSCRNFHLEKLPGELEDLVQRAVGETRALFPDEASDVRIVYWRDDRETVAKNLTLGYDKVASPPQFLLGVGRPSTHWLEELGYRMEQVILRLTDLGLATLWVGGAFDQEELTRTLPLQEGEEVAVLCPVGFAKEGATSVQRVSKALTYLLTGNKRKPFAEWVFHEVWGRSPEQFFQDHPDWEKIFRYTRLAPSWANIQPWRFVVRDAEVLAMVEKTIKDRMVDHERGGRDYKRLDLGIAMAHFDLVSQTLGKAGRWQPWHGRGLSIPSRVQGIAQWREST